MLKLSEIKRQLCSQQNLTLSTVLTISRIVLAPLVVAAMVAQRWGTAFVLFVVAALTDALDGWLARVLHQKTMLGACLDPIADKVLLLSVYSALAFVQSPLFSIPVWFVVLVLFKELVLIFGTTALFFVRGAFEIKPTILAKSSTVIQMLFIVWLFACYFFQWLPVKTYYTMLGLVIVLLLVTLIDYIRMGCALTAQHK